MAADGRELICDGTFITEIISKGLFESQIKVECVTSFDNGGRVFFGTETGVYMADSEFKQPATKILAVTKVKQIAAIEEFQLLIVLSHRSLQVYSISAVVGRPPTAQMVQTVQGHCSVFKEGSYMGKYLICSVDSSTFSSTGRVFELETCTPKATKDLPTKDTVSLKLFKEFYLPCTTSAVFLIDSAVCLACTNGFNLLSLDSLEVKTFPHTTNRLSNWTFFWKNTTAKHVQPMNDDLLLSYSDVSLLINREGQRTRPEWHIDWNSRPQSFSLLHPWIIAFNDHFVEFRNIEQDTAYVLVRKKTRLLYGDRGKIFFSYRDDQDETIIATINLQK